MTPSAAKRILLAIYGKPEFEWIVEKIHVMRSIRKDTMVVKSPKGQESTLQTCTDLVDVEYIIEARIALNPARTTDLAKYIGEAARRLATGRRFQPIYLGIREYEAYYELLPRDTRFNPIADSRPLGPILYANVPISFAQDRYESVFFDGALVNGTLTVPEELHEEFVPQIMAKVHERATLFAAQEVSP